MTRLPELWGQPSSVVTVEWDDPEPQLAETVSALG